MVFHGNTRFSVTEVAIAFMGKFYINYGLILQNEGKTHENSQPRSITMIVKTFSQSVLGDTLPKPTLVMVLKVKYMAVMYFSFRKQRHQGEWSAGHGHTCRGRGMKRN